MTVLEETLQEKIYQSKQTAKRVQMYWDVLLRYMQEAH